MTANAPARQVRLLWAAASALFGMMLAVGCGKSTSVNEAQTRTTIQPSAAVPAVNPTDSTPTTLPFVGCKTDGQVGEQEAPQGTSPTIPALTTQETRGLAYYKVYDLDFGVLAPRNWYCFGTGGSNGSTLYISE